MGIDNKKKICTDIVIEKTFVSVSDYHQKNEINRLSKY